MSTIIKIQNPISKKWENADLFTSGKDSIIALTFEANPIGELKHRQANISNLVKIPRTPKNNMLMGFAAEISETQRIPYKRIDCRVIADGVPIFKEGSFLRLMSITDEHYEINIFSGISDLFNTLSNTELRNLPPNSLGTIDWSAQGVIDTKDNDVCLPIIDWNVEDNPTSLSDGKLDEQGNFLENPFIQVSTLYPCVKLPRLLDEILAQHGYTLNTDVRNDERFQNTAVPCVRGLPTPLEGDGKWKGNYTRITENNVLIPFLHPYNFIQGSQANSSEKVGSFSDNFYYNASDEYSLLFDMPADGTYFFEIKGNFGSKAKWIVILTDEYGRTDHIQNVPSSEDTRFIIEHKAIKPSTLKIAIMGMINTHKYRLWVSKLSIDCIKYEPTTDDIFPNYQLPIVRNLPDVSQLDVVKQFLLMFGQMVYVDNVKKELVGYNFKTVYDQISEKNRLENPAKYDWSDKVTNETKDIKFTLHNYGKESIIKYKEVEYTNEDDKEITLKSEGRFYIDNEHLEEKKDLFEFPATCVDEFHRFNRKDKNNIDLKLAKIRYREKAQPTGDLPFMVVYLEKDNYEEILIDLKEVFSVKTDIKGLQYASFKGNDTIKKIEAQELIDRYYLELTQGIMRKCRVYNETLYLLPTDIHNFTHKRPIYLAKYNKWFYVNKIDKFMANKLTNVELVYLPIVI